MKTMVKGGPANTLLCQMLWVQLSPLLLSKNSDKFSLHYIYEFGPILVKYHSWISESIKYLEDESIISCLDSENTYKENPKSIKDPWRVWEENKELWLEDPLYKTQVVILEAALRALPKILVGELESTGVLFPNGSFDLVEGVYKNSPLADIYNKAIAKSVVGYVESRIKAFPDVEINILEIGAGTGGTSSLVLKNLNAFKNNIGEYCYTDVSDVFLKSADERFSEKSPFLKTKLLNIENTLESQGVKKGHYDIVIAANVLHATKNIKSTIDNVASALKSGGFVFLSEICDRDLFSHLTFGLLDGWWLYNDSELRIPGSPGLFPKTWHSLLIGQGFKEVSFPLEKAHVLGQQIIIAEFNGRKYSECDISSVGEEVLSDDSELKNRNKYDEKLISNNSESLIFDKTLDFICEIIAKVLKVRKDKLFPQKPLESYGLDSIQVVKLTSEFSNYLPGITSTLFFEYKTIETLAEYLVKKYQDNLENIFNLDKKINEKTDVFSEKKIHHESFSEEFPSGVIKTKNQEKPKNITRSSIDKPKIKSLSSEDIAVVGLHGRYPKANNLDEFWDNLKQSKNVITEIPLGRWHISDYYDKEKTIGGHYSKWGGFIDGFDCFDPLFFNISPKEAQMMDPQERTFLEVVYATIEDAGYTPLTLNKVGAVGVFVGVMNGYYPLGSQYWSIANRISYSLDFNGPSLAVDTACSSSLTAIHLALESLYSGTSDCAIVGGVNLISDPQHFINLSTMNMVSTGNKCKSFGNKADGFVDGEGVGAMVLKKLDEAISDNDHIYGVIKGSMINSGGKTHGYTVPNPEAQKKVIVNAIKRSGIDASTISYVEAHGTGTALGDPIEISSLKKAFEVFTDNQQFCALGSVKSNIGHTESAAGIAGITKVFLQMKHQKLVPTIHSNEVNPEINFSETPFYLQHEFTDWNRLTKLVDGDIEEIPRRASISSFGAGGANAHVVLEEYDDSVRENFQNNNHNDLPFILPISAKSDDNLKLYVEKIISYFDKLPQQDGNHYFERLAYTFQVGRVAMSNRLAILSYSVDEMLNHLKGFLSGETLSPNVFYGNAKSSREIEDVFSTPEEQSDLIESLLKMKKYSKIMSLWAKGIEVDWGFLYENKTPQKISAPTYPFTRDKYWVDKKYLKKDTNNKENYLPISRDEKRSIKPLVFSPSWVQGDINQCPHTNERAKCFVILLGKTTKKYDDIRDCLDDSTIVQYVSNSTELDSIYRDYCLKVFTLIQEILADKPKHEMLLQLIIDTEEGHDVLLGLSGLLKSVSIENPRIMSQIITVDMGVPNIDLAELITSNGISPEFEYQSIRYIGNNREVLTWTEIPPEKFDVINKSPLRNNGVYLILGGIGGIGSIVAEEIINNFDGHVVLVGRSALDESKNSFMQRLGERATYKQVDIANLRDANALISDILERFGDLHGIFHFAGVIHDKYFQYKDSSEIDDVLAPKVKGLVNIDKATKLCNLDFLALASSVAAVLGSQGQADYAAANAFMDNYCGYRNKLVNKGERKGKTISVNWPLWENGGMTMDKQAINLLNDSIGFEELSNDVGLKLLINSLSIPESQIMVLNCERENLIGMLEHAGLIKNNDTSINLNENPQVVNSSKYIQSSDTSLSNSIISLISENIKAMICNIISLDINKLDIDESLDNYGINSIMITQFNKSLIEYIDRPIKTLIYEYPTVRELSKYLVEYHFDDCVRWTGGKEDRKIPKNDDIGIINQEVKNDKVDSRDDLSSLSPDLSSQKKHENQPIAIVGLAGKYPGASGINEFWNNLCEGLNSIVEIPKLRWDHDPHYREDVETALSEFKSYSKWGGFLSGFEKFDPMFFNMSPREVYNIDPQERQVLMACWEALEDSGYTSGALEKKYGKQVGVFVGVTKTGFSLYTQDDFNPKGLGDNSSGLPFLPNTSFSSMANRVSYQLNLSGPSFAIDTMCSSSISAIYEACESIHRGDSELALVSAVNLYLHPRNFVNLSLGGLIADGSSVSCFSEKGTGFIPGEGVGAIVLKSLDQAINSKDHIYGVIKSCAVNHSGRSFSYLTPSVEPQKQLIQNVLSKSKYKADDIQYIESAANGAAVSDAVEFRALSDVFHGVNQKCFIGSVKTKIGHLEAASGMSQLTKVLCQFKHKMFSPSGFDKDLIDPSLRWDQGCFKLIDTPTKFSSKEGNPNNALITSFGAGGSYGAMVVESYVENEKINSSLLNSHNSKLIILSARNDERLKVYANLLKIHLDNNEENLESLAYTLQVGRNPMRIRFAVVVSSLDELKEALSNFVNEVSDQRIYTNTQVDSASNNAKENILNEDDKRLALSQQNLDQLASFWIDGVDDIAWDELYPEPVPRLSLPSYPFELRSYWHYEPDQLKTGIENINSLVEDKINTSYLDRADSSAVLEVQIDNEPFDGFEIHEDESWDTNVTDDESPLELNDSGSNKSHLNPISKQKITLTDEISNSKEDVLTALMTVLREILLLQSNEYIDEHTDFVSVGLDSLSRVHFIKKLNSLFNMNLRETLIFDYPTVGHLCGYIAEKIKPLNELTEEKYIASEQGKQFIVQIDNEPFDGFEIHEGESWDINTTDDKPSLELNDADSNKLHSNQIAEQKITLTSETSNSKEDVLTSLVTVLRGTLLLQSNEYIDEHTDFISVGLDSLSRVHFIKKLSSLFNISLRETLIFDYPTIGRLCGYIIEKIKPLNESPEEKHIASEQSRQVIEHSSFLVRLKSAMKKYPEITPLHHEGAGRVLYCFHPMSGEVSLYQKMASFGQDDYRVIAIKSRGFLSDAPMLDTVEEMGEYAAKAIMAVDPHGPYCLVGSSMGGLVAYEAVRTLQRLGKTVEVLFLIETPLVDNDSEADLWKISSSENWIMNANYLIISNLHLDQEFLNRKKQGLVDWADELLDLQEYSAFSDQELIDILVREISHRGSKSTIIEIKKQLLSMSKVHGNNLKALANYRFNNLENISSLNVFSFQTEQSLAVSPKGYNPPYLVNVDAKKGSLVPFLNNWKKHIPMLESVVFYDVDTHYDLLTSSNASQMIAESINVILTRSESAESITPLQTVDHVDNKIAIIGMSGRFPGAESIDDFWENLHEGRSSISDIPENRKSDSCWQGLTQRGGYLTDIGNFDAGFFGVTPKEAELLEPCERLFLQESWKAIEDSGTSPEELSGANWGVFCGAYGDYSLLVNQLKGISPHVTNSNIAARVAYSLDLAGPVVSMDSGCASSMQSIEQACDYLLEGKCDVAIAGGAFIMSTPNIISVAKSVDLLSSAQEVKALTKDAKGMFPGESVAALVLKPLSAALVDGDNIYGVIDAWGSNHSGRTNGMTSPSGKAQKRLIQNIYNKFNVDAESIGLVEANANGTPTGDTIEIEALNDAFQKFTSRKSFCALSTVENNIGHGYHNSGIAHLIKLILCLKHQAIPAMPNVDEVNPDFDILNTAFYANKERIAWPHRPGIIRRGAASSFGATGTNAHVVLSEAPTKHIEPEEEKLTLDGAVIICLSAKTSEALQQSFINLSDYIDRVSSSEKESLNISQLSHHLMCRRSHYHHRCAIVVRNDKELKSSIQNLVAGVCPENSFLGDGNTKLSPAFQALGKSIIEQPDSSAELVFKKLTELADLFSLGFDLKHYGRDLFNKNYSPIYLLPTYPFENHRHWISPEQENLSDHHEISFKNRKEKNEFESKYISIIIGAISEVTGYSTESLDITKPFGELGLDSILSIRLLSALNNEVSIELSLMDLSENNSITLLNEFILSRLKNLVDIKTDVEPLSYQNASSIANKWLCYRLKSMPSLIVKTIELPEQLANCEADLFDSEVSSLIQQGVALYRDKYTGHFLTNNKCNLWDELITRLGSKRIENIFASIPMETIVSAASQEQKRNLFYSVVKENNGWNVSHVLKLSTRINNIENLKKAFKLYASEQDSLKTRFFTLNDNWVQLVDVNAPISMEIVNFTSVSQMTDFIIKERNKLIDVTSMPLFRFYYMDIGGSSYFAYVSHHAIADVNTSTLLFNGVVDIYNKINLNVEPQLMESMYQYWGYTLDQFDTLIYNNETTLEYWKSQLNNGEVKLKLPYRKSFDLDDTNCFQEAKCLISFPDVFMEKMLTFCKNKDVSIAQLFAAILILMLRSLGNKNILLQLFSSHRDRKTLFDMMGDFSNIIFLDFKSEEEVFSFEEIDLDGLLAQVKGLMLKGVNNGKVDFEDLLNCLGYDNISDYIREDESVVFDFINIDSISSSLNDSVGHSVDVDELKSFDRAGMSKELIHLDHGDSVKGKDAIAKLFFQVFKIDENIHLNLKYRKNLFEKSKVEGLGVLFYNIADYVVSTTTKKNSVSIKYLNGLTQKLSNELFYLNPKITSLDKKYIHKSTDSQIKMKSVDDCIKLNSIDDGDPIFWIHALWGGVENYFGLANKIKRPFYGIQAKGWLTDDEPLSGVVAMAKHYSKVIQEFQSEGPYDIGGYSIGGLLAYEVARQIQLCGQEVRSIVMVDTLDLDSMRSSAVSRKSRFLQVANLVIKAGIEGKGTKPDDRDNNLYWKDKLIPGNELDLNDDDEVFFEKLIVLLKDRGFVGDHIKDSVMSMEKMSYSFKLDDYTLEALPRSKNIQCLYLRNKSGSMFGGLEDFFSVDSKEIGEINSIDCFSDWKKYIKYMSVIDIESSSHIDMLASFGSINEIGVACENIYK